MTNTTNNQLQVLSTCTSATISASKHGTHAYCKHCTATVYPTNTSVQGAIQAHLSNPRQRVMINGKVWVV